MIDPAGLDQRGIVFQAVVLLELREVLDHPRGQAVLLGLFAAEREHLSGRRHALAFLPRRAFLALGELAAGGCAVPRR